MLEEILRSQSPRELSSSSRGRNDKYKCDEKVKKQALKGTVKLETFNGLNNLGKKDKNLESNVRDPRSPKQASIICFAYQNHILAGIHTIFASLNI